MAKKVPLEMKTSYHSMRRMDVFTEDDFRKITEGLNIIGCPEEFQKEINRAATLLIVSQERLYTEPTLAEQRKLLNKIARKSKDLLQLLKILVGWHVAVDVQFLGNLNNEIFHSLKHTLPDDLEKFNHVLPAVLSFLEGDTLARKERLERKVKENEVAAHDFKEKIEECTHKITQLNRLPEQNLQEKQELQYLYEERNRYDSFVKVLEAQTKCLIETMGEDTKGMNNQSMQPMRFFIEHAADLFEKYTGETPTITTHSFHGYNNYDTYSGKFFRFVVGCKLILVANPVFHEVRWPSPKPRFDGQTLEDRESNLGWHVKEVILERNKQLKRS